MQGIDLGTAIFTTGLDLSGIKSDINQVKSMMTNLNFDLSINVPRISTLKPKVDQTELHALNKTFDLKVAHAKRVQRYFDANPLRPKVNTKELKELGVLLDGVRASSNVELDATYKFDKTAIDILREIARNTDPARQARFNAKILERAIEDGVRKANDPGLVGRAGQIGKAAWGAAKFGWNITTSPLKMVGNITQAVTGALITPIVGSIASVASGIGMEIGSMIVGGFSDEWKSNLGKTGSKSEEYLRKRYRTTGQAVGQFFGFEQIQDLEKSAQWLGNRFDDWLDPDEFEKKIDKIEHNLAKFVDKIAENGDVIGAVKGAFDTHIKKPLFDDILAELSGARNVITKLTGDQQKEKSLLVFEKQNAISGGKLEQEVRRQLLQDNSKVIEQRLFRNQVSKPENAAIVADVLGFVPTADRNTSQYAQQQQKYQGFLQRYYGGDESSKARLEKLAKTLEKRGFETKPSRKFDSQKLVSSFRSTYKQEDIEVEQKRVLDENLRFRKILYAQTKLQYQLSKEIGGLRESTVRLVGTIVRISGALTALSKRITIQKMIRDAQKESEKLLIDFPLLAEGEKGYIFAVGGAQMKGGSGSDEIAKGYSALYPGMRVIPVRNPNTDRSGNDARQAEKNKQTLLYQIAKQFMPDVAGDETQMNTLLNMNSLIEGGLIKQYDADAVQLAARVLAAKRLGYTDDQIAASSFSLGGQNLVNVAMMLKDMGINSKSIAMAFPHSGLQSRNLPNFESVINFSDPLTFGISSGLIAINKQQRLLYQDRYGAGSKEAANYHSLQATASHPMAQESLGRIPGYRQPAADTADVVANAIRLPVTMQHIQALEFALSGMEPMEAVTAFDPELFNDALVRVRGNLFGSFAEIADFLAKIVPQFNRLTAEGDDLMNTLAKNGDAELAAPILEIISVYERAQKIFSEYGTAIYEQAKNTTDEQGNPNVSPELAEKLDAMNPLQRSSYLYASTKILSERDGLESAMKAMRTGKDTGAYFYNPTDLKLTKSRLDHLDKMIKYFNQRVKTKNLDPDSYEKVEAFVKFLEKFKSEIEKKTKNPEYKFKKDFLAQSIPLVGNPGEINLAPIPAQNNLAALLELLNAERTKTQEKEKEQIVNAYQQAVEDYRKGIGPRPDPKKYRLPSEVSPKFTHPYIKAIYDAIAIGLKRVLEETELGILAYRPELVTQYNDLVEKLGDNAPRLDDIDVAAQGHAGGTAFLTETEAYKVSKTAGNKSEVKAYEMIGGRLAPRLLDHGEGYIVTERLPNKALKRQFESGDIGFGELKQGIRMMGRLLKQMHEMGVVHNDLAPSNVFITPYGAKAIDLEQAKTRHDIDEEGDPIDFGAAIRQDLETAKQRILFDFKLSGINIADLMKNPLKFGRAGKKAFDLINELEKGYNASVGTAAQSREVVNAAFISQMGTELGDKLKWQFGEMFDDKFSDGLRDTFVELLTSALDIDPQEVAKAFDKAMSKGEPWRYLQNVQAEREIANDAELDYDSLDGESRLLLTQMEKTFRFLNLFIDNLVGTRNTPNAKMLRQLAAQLPAISPGMKTNTGATSVPLGVQGGPTRYIDPAVQADLDRRVVDIVNQATSGGEIDVFNADMDQVLQVVADGLDDFVSDEMDLAQLQENADYLNSGIAKVSNGVDALEQHIARLSEIYEKLGHRTDLMPTAIESMGLAIEENTKRLNKLKSALAELQTALDKNQDRQSFRSQTPATQAVQTAMAEGLESGDPRSLEYLKGYLADQVNTNPVAKALLGYLNEVNIRVPGEEGTIRADAPPKNQLTDLLNFQDVSNIIKVLATDLGGNTLEAAKRTALGAKELFQQLQALEKQALESRPGLKGLKGFLQQLMIGGAILSPPGQAIAGSVLGAAGNAFMFGADAIANLIDPIVAQQLAPLTDLMIGPAKTAANFAGSMAEIQLPWNLGGIPGSQALSGIADANLQAARLAAQQIIHAVSQGLGEAVLGTGLAGLGLGGRTIAKVIAKQLYPSQEDLTKALEGKGISQDVARKLAESFEADFIAKLEQEIDAIAPPAKALMPQKEKATVEVMELADIQSELATAAETLQKLPSSKLMEQARELASAPVKLDPIASMNRDEALKVKEARELKEFHDNLRSFATAVNAEIVTPLAETFRSRIKKAAETGNYAEFSAQDLESLQMMSSAMQIVAARRAELLQRRKLLMGSGNSEIAKELEQIHIGGSIQGVLKKGSNLLKEVSDPIAAKVKIASSIPEEFRDIGENAAIGFAKGFSTSVQGVKTAVTGLTRAAIETAEQTLDIQSPSKVMMRIGEMTGKGLELGLLESFMSASKAATQLTKKIITAIKNELGIASPSKVMIKIGQEMVAGLDQGIDDQKAKSIGRRFALSLLEGYYDVIQNFSPEIIVPGMDKLGNAATFKELYVGLDKVSPEYVDSMLGSYAKWIKKLEIGGSDSSLLYHDAVDHGTAEYLGAPSIIPGKDSGTPEDKYNRAVENLVVFSRHLYEVDRIEQSSLLDISNVDEFIPGFRATFSGFKTAQDYQNTVAPFDPSFDIRQYYENLRKSVYLISKIRDETLKLTPILTGRTYYRDTALDNGVIVPGLIPHPIKRPGFDEVKKDKSDAVMRLLASARASTGETARDTSKPNNAFDAYNLEKVAEQEGLIIADAHRALFKGFSEVIEPIEMTDILHGLDSQQFAHLGEKQANSYLQAWLNFLGISSPSKRFIQIGLDMMRGLDIGTVIGGKAVLKTITGLVVAMTAIMADGAMAAQKIQSEAFTGMLMNPAETKVEVMYGKDLDRKAFDDAKANVYTSGPMFDKYMMSGESGEKVNMIADIVQGGKFIQRSKNRAAVEQRAFFGITKQGQLKFGYGGADSNKMSDYDTFIGGLHALYNDEVKAPSNYKGGYWNGFKQQQAFNTARPRVFFGKTKSGQLATMTNKFDMTPEQIEKYSRQMGFTAVLLPDHGNMTRHIVPKQDFGRIVAPSVAQGNPRLQSGKSTPYLLRFSDQQGLAPRKVTPAQQSDSAKIQSQLQSQKVNPVLLWMEGVQQFTNNLIKSIPHLKEAAALLVAIGAAGLGLSVSKQLDKSIRASNIRTRPQLVELPDPVREELLHQVVRQSDPFNPQSILDGVKSLNYGKVATKHGQGYIEAFKRVLEISSPSKKMIRIGQQMIQGLRIGIANQTPGVIKQFSVLVAALAALVPSPGMAGQQLNLNSFHGMILDPSQTSVELVRGWNKDNEAFQDRKASLYTTGPMFSLWTGKPGEKYDTLADIVQSGKFIQRSKNRAAAEQRAFFGITKQGQLKFGYGGADSNKMSDYDTFIGGLHSLYNDDVPAPANYKGGYNSSPMQIGGFIAPRPRVAFGNKNGQLVVLRTKTDMLPNQLERHARSMGLSSLYLPDHGTKSRYIIPGQHKDVLNSRDGHVPYLLRFAKKDFAPPKPKATPSPTPQVKATPSPTPQVKATPAPIPTPAATQNLEQVAQEMLAAENQMSWLIGGLQDFGPFIAGLGLLAEVLRRLAPKSKRLFELLKNIKSKKRITVSPQSVSIPRYEVDQETINFIRENTGQHADQVIKLLERHGPSVLGGFEIPKPSPTASLVSAVSPPLPVAALPPVNKQLIEEANIRAAQQQITVEPIQGIAPPQIAPWTPPPTRQGLPTMGGFIAASIPPEFQSSRSTPQWTPLEMPPLGMDVFEPITFEEINTEQTVQQVKKAIVEQAQKANIEANESIKQQVKQIAQDIQEQTQSINQGDFTPANETVSPKLADNLGSRESANSKVIKQFFLEMGEMYGEQSVRGLLQTIQNQASFSFKQLAELTSVLLNTSQQEFRGWNTKQFIDLVRDEMGIPIPDKGSLTPQGQIPGELPGRASVPLKTTAKTDDNRPDSEYKATDPKNIPSFNKPDIPKSIQIVEQIGKLYGEKFLQALMRTIQSGKKLTLQQNQAIMTAAKGVQHSGVEDVVAAKKFMKTTRPHQVSHVISQTRKQQTGTSTPPTATGGGASGGGAGTPPGGGNGAGTPPPPPPPEPQPIPPPVPQNMTRQPAPPGSSSKPPTPGGKGGGSSSTKKQDIPFPVRVWDQLTAGVSNFYDKLKTVFPQVELFKNILWDIGRTALIGFGIYSLGDAIVNFGRFALETSVNFERMEQSIRAVSESSSAAERNIDTIYNAAHKYKQDIGVFMEGGANIFAASRGTSLEGFGDQQIIETMAQASLVRQLDPQKTQQSLIALEQMLSKGNVSAEELRRQLGNALPGAFQIAARSMGMTTAELDSMLRQGELLSVDFLPRFMEQLSAETAGGVPGAAATAQARINEFNNSMTLAARNIGDQLGPFRDIALWVGKLGFEWLSASNIAPKLILILSLLTGKILVATGAWKGMVTAMKSTDWAGAGKGAAKFIGKIILLQVAVEALGAVWTAFTTDGTQGLREFNRQAKIDLGLEKQTEQVNLLAKALEGLRWILTGENIVDIGANIIDATYVLRPVFNGLQALTEIAKGEFSWKHFNPLKQITRGSEQRFNDWMTELTDQNLTNVPTLLNRTQANMDLIPQVEALSSQIQALEAKRAALPPGSRDERNQIRDEINRLNMERKKLQAPLSKDSALLQSFIDNQKAQLERIDQELKNIKLSPEQRSLLETQRSNTQGALDDLIEAQNKIQAVLRKNLDAMGRLLYNAERAMWAVNQIGRRADREAAARNRAVLQAQAQGTLGQPFASVIQARSEITRAQTRVSSWGGRIRSFEEEMAALPKFGEVLKNLEIELKDIADVDPAKLQAKADSDYGKTPEAQNAIKAIEKYQQMIQQYESDLDALANAQKSLYDANLALARGQEDMAIQERDYRIQLRDIGFQVREMGWQIDDYFWNLKEAVRNIRKTFEDAIIQSVRSAEDSILEVQRITNQMRRRDARSDLRRALSGGIGGMMQSLMESMTEFVAKMFDDEDITLQGQQQQIQTQRNIQDVERARVDFKFAMEAQTRQLAQMPRQLEQIIRSSIDLQNRIDDAARAIRRAREDFFGVNGTLQSNLAALNRLNGTLGSGIERLAKTIQQSTKPQIPPASTANNKPPTSKPEQKPPAPIPVPQPTLPHPTTRQGSLKPQGIGAGNPGNTIRENGLVNPFNPPPPPGFGADVRSPLDRTLPRVDELSTRINNPPHSAGNLRFYNPLQTVSRVRYWLNVKNEKGIDNVEGFAKPLAELLQQYGEIRFIRVMQDLLTDPKTNQALKDAVKQKLNKLNPFSPRTSNKLPGSSQGEVARQQSVLVASLVSDVPLLSGTQSTIPFDPNQPGLTKVSESLVKQRPDAFDLNSEEGRARLAIAMAIAGTEKRGNYGNPNLDLGRLYGSWAGAGRKMKGPFQLNTNYFSREASTMQSQNDFMADVLLGLRPRADSKAQKDYGAALVEAMRSGQVTTPAQLQKWLDDELGWGRGGRSWEALHNGFRDAAASLPSNLMNWLQHGGGVPIDVQASRQQPAHQTSPQPANLPPASGTMLPSTTDWQTVSQFISSGLQQGLSPEQIGSMIPSNFVPNIQENTQAIQGLTNAIQGTPTDATPFNELAGIHIPVQTFSQYQSPSALIRQTQDQALSGVSAADRALMQQGQNQVDSRLRPLLERSNAITGSIDTNALMSSYDAATNRQIQELTNLGRTQQQDTLSQLRENEAEMLYEFRNIMEQAFTTRRELDEGNARSPSELFQTRTMFLSGESLGLLSDLVSQAEQIRSQQSSVNEEIRKLTLDRSNVPIIIAEIQKNLIKNANRLSPEQKQMAEEMLNWLKTNAIPALNARIGVLQQQSGALANQATIPRQLYMENLQNQIYQSRLRSIPGQYSSWMFAGQGQAVAEAQQRRVFDLEMAQAADTAARLGLNVEEVKAQIIELNKLKLDEIDREFKDLGETVTEQMAGPVQNFLGELIKGKITIEEAFQQLIDSLLDMFTKLFTDWMMGQFLSIFNFGGNNGIFGGGGFLGGIFGFADGGKVPVVKQGIPGPGEIQDALKREGPNAVLATLTPGEQVLPVYNGEAQLYRQLFPEGIKEAYRNRQAMAKIPQYNRGGMVGGSPIVATGGGATTSTVSVSVPITINAENQADQSRYNEFAKSLRPDMEKLVDKRIQEAQRPGGILFGR